MSNSISSVFGAILAFLLFVLYIAIIGYMLAIIIMRYSPESGEIQFREGLTYVVTTIGGLVSALVIARLALTNPGENPARLKVRNREGEEKDNRFATMFASVYLGGWIIVGVSCLIVGLIWYPGASKTISDIGTNWFGLAVAASYSYFGVRPSV